MEIGAQRREEYDSQGNKSLKQDEAKQMINHFSKSLFDLQFEIECILYISEASEKAKKFNQTKTNYLDMCQLADEFFSTVDLNQVDIRQTPQFEMTFKKANEQQLNLPGQSQNKNNQQGKNNEVCFKDLEKFQDLQIYPLVTKNMVRNLQEKLKTTLRQERQYFEILNSYDKQQLKGNQQIFSLETFKKERQSHIQEAISSLQEVIALLQDSINYENELTTFQLSDQQVEIQYCISEEISAQTKSQEQQVEEEEEKICKQASASQIAKWFTQKKHLSVIKSLKKSYTSREYISMTPGKDVFYVGNSNQNIDVLDFNFNLVATIDIQGKKMLNCIEIDKSIIICSSYLDRKLYKLSKPSYMKLDQLQFDSRIRHILQWDGPILILCTGNGELVLFEVNQFKVLQKVKLSNGFLNKAVRCLEDNSKILACGEHGVFVAEVQGTNSIVKVDKHYCHQEWISDIVQVKEFLYVVGYCDRNKKLVGVIDSKSNVTQTIDNHLRTDYTNAVELVQGLNDLVIIQTSHDLFLLNATYRSLVHVIDTFYLGILPNLACIYDKENLMLKIYALEKEDEKKNVVEVQAWIS